MLKNLKVVFAAAIIITLMVSLSGCTASNTDTTPAKKNYAPDEVVVKFWNAIDSGKYNEAFSLAYQSDPDVSETQWVEERESRWGINGANINIYNFTVIRNTELPPDTFQGNFSEIRSITVNAEVAYMGQNSSGPSQFVVVNTTEGWKVLGNY